MDTLLQPGVPRVARLPDPPTCNDSNPTTLCARSSRVTAPHRKSLRTNFIGVNVRDRSPELKTSMARRSVSSVPARSSATTARVFEARPGLSSHHARQRAGSCDLPAPTYPLGVFRVADVSTGDAALSACVSGFEFPEPYDLRGGHMAVSFKDRRERPDAPTNLYAPPKT